MGKGMFKGIRIGAGLGMGLGAWMLAKTAWDNRHDVNAAAINVVNKMVGYNLRDGTFDYKQATAGMTMLAGVGVSYLAAKTGVNRYTPTGINL
ncbi:unnamed protein product [marine sediment metagenome]|uniref:Uncharacterized protein n=1 Tax=marine sediment metagenome TaxID=412755 RepID=X1CL44_9ZZZZ